MCDNVRFQFFHIAFWAETCCFSNDSCLSAIESTTCPSQPPPVRRQVSTPINFQKRNTEYAILLRLTFSLQATETCCLSARLGQCSVRGDDRRKGNKNITNISSFTMRFLELGLFGGFSFGFLKNYGCWLPGRAPPVRASRFPQPQGAISSSQRSKAKDPKPKIPSQRSKTIDSQPRIPSQRSKAKEPKPEIPSQRSQATDPEPNNPSRRSKAKIPKRKIRSQRSQAKGPKTKIRNQRSQAKHPKPSIQSQRSKVKDPKSKISSHLKLSIRSPRSQAKDPKPEIRNQRSKAKDPKSTIPKKSS